ncbi:hypothetical protein ACVXHB_19135 [Escherichia coli]
MNIRMMTLLQDTQDGVSGRLLDEAKRMTQDALRTPPGWRMRTGQDDSVGQEGQGHFRMKYHIGWCEQEAIVQDERLAARPEEKLSRMSREQQNSWNAAKRTGAL